MNVCIKKNAKNNVSQGLRFLNCMKAHIIISSSCYQTSLLMSLSKGRVRVELAISLEKYECERLLAFSYQNSK